MTYVEKYDSNTYEGRIKNILENITLDEKINKKVMKKNKKLLSVSTCVLNELASQSKAEVKSFYAIKAALEYGVEPKNLSLNNFIFGAIESEKSEEFILKTLELGIKYNLNLNYRNEKGNTIFLEMLEQSYFTDDILNVYELLRDNGYNILLENNQNKNIEYLINNSKKEYKNKEEFLKIYHQDKEELLKREVTLDDLKNKYCEDNLGEIAIKVIKDKIDEDYKLKLINDLINFGFDINLPVQDGFNIVMCYAYQKGTSFNYLYKLLELCINNKLDINYVDYANDTVLHGLILTKNYKDRIIPIYELLMKNGFNDNRKNRNSYDIYSLAMKEECIFSDKEEFINKYCLKKKFNEINEDDLEYLKVYGSFIENNNTKSYHKFNLRDPHNNLGVMRLFFMEFKDKKIVLLTGKEGIGLNETLMCSGEYEHKRYGTTIYQINVDEILKKCQTISSLKPTIINILRKCASNNIMVFIYDIDKIYGKNFSNEDKDEINNYIEYLVEKKNLVLKGTLNIDKRCLFEYTNINNLIDYVMFYEPQSSQIFSLLNFEIEHNLIIDEELKKLINELLIIINKKDNRLNYDMISIRKVIKDLIKNINDYLIINNLNVVDIDSIVYALNNLDNVKREVLNNIINEINNEKNDIKYKKLTR